MDLTARLISDDKFVKVGDDMTWPAITEKVRDIEWRIRYAPDTLSRGDLMVAASIIEAYAEIIKMPVARRNPVCRAIRSVL